MSSIEKPIDTEEAALFLNISTETLRRKAQAGEVPASKPGKGWIFIKEDLIKYIRSLYHGDSIVYAIDTNFKEGIKCQYSNDIVKKITESMYGSPTFHQKMEKELDDLLTHQTN